MYSYLLTGVIAGIASSVLYISGTMSTPLSMFLYFLAPLPLFITGLGWGAISAAAGALAGVIVCTIMAGIPGGAIFFATTGLMPIILSYYALMSRPVEDNDPSTLTGTTARDWYPLGQLILWIATFSTVLTAAFILFIMPSTPELTAALETLFGTVIDQNPELKARLGGEDAVEQMVGLFVALLPATLAGYTFVTTTANLWLAGKIITASGRGIRPQFEVSSLFFPRVLPLVLVGILALTFLPGTFHVVALAAAASLTMTFMFLGLVVVHAIVPKIPTRTAILSMVYVTVLVLLKYAFLGLALVGIAETIFGIRNRFTHRLPPGNSGTPPAPGDT